MIGMRNQCALLYIDMSKEKLWLEWNQQQDGIEATPGTVTELAWRAIHRAQSYCKNTLIYIYMYMLV